MADTSSAHVADIVTETPATIAVFQRHHIELCCAGHVPLQVDCEHEGLDVASLIDELPLATHPFGEADDWHYALPDVREDAILHLENDVLFPGALTLGRSGDAASVGVV